MQSQVAGDFRIVCRSLDAVVGLTGLIIMEHCGGASGPIWGSAFRAAARSAKGKATLSVDDFAQLMQAAVSGIQATGERSFGRIIFRFPSRKESFILRLSCVRKDEQTAQRNVFLGRSEGASLKASFDAGAAAAMEGAKSTEKIAARMGRAGTVGERSIGYADGRCGR